MTSAGRRELTLLNGRWQSASDDAWLPVTDPADTDRTVAFVPALSAVDVADAYASADDGHRRWMSVSSIERGSVLLAAGQLLRDRAGDIAEDLVAEMGKTTAEAKGEVGKAADFFEYYGGMGRSPSGYTLPDVRPDTFGGVIYESVGVVLAITPWNDPILTPARKIAPALITGNSVLLKPSTDTPLVALHLARALLDAGLPPDTLSVITGRGSELSGPLLEDPRLAAVSFTGSNAVGHGILAGAQGRNVRIQTEMGGKNAAAVLADADLDMAADTIASAAFAQAGQRCTATSRVVVDRAVASDLIDRLRHRAAGLAVGPGSDPRTGMGPLVNRNQQASVVQHVTDAVDAGARVDAGGGIPADPALSVGCYVEPTILTDVDPAMPIWREEVFGPVLVVRVVDGFEQACAAVNDSPYGLSASLFTTSLPRAHAFIEAAQVGQVSINLPTSGWDVHQPFGGFKDSGSPFKEQGLESLSFYRRVKSYAIRRA